MKNYYLYLKSHCELPDFEYEVEAGSHEEALKKIRRETGHSLDEWGDDILLDNIGVVADIKSN